MSEADSTHNLLELLETHRRRLRHLRQQVAVFDPGFVPSHVALGLAEAWRDVAEVKANLRSSGVPVDDLPEDEVPPSLASPSRADGTGRASRFNIQGPIQAGAVNLGGVMNIGTPIKVMFGDGSAARDGMTIGESPGEPPRHSRVTLLATQIEAVLGRAPSDSTSVTTNVLRRMRALVEAVASSVPDRDLVVFQAESLRRAAAPLASILPDIGSLVEALISACNETGHTYGGESL